MRRTLVFIALGALATLGDAAAAPTSMGGQTCPADPLANATPTPLAVPAGVVVHRDLAYVTGGHARQKLDLWLPAKKKGPFPVIVYIHGGGWKHGNKSSSLTPIDYVAQGYAVASIDYRLSSDAIFPAQIEDARAAVRFLRAAAKTYSLDGDRFAAWGESAGAHLANLLGTAAGEDSFDTGENLRQSSAVQAVVDYYGPTDLLQMDAQALDAASATHDKECSPESQLIGGALQQHKRKARRANPINYIGRRPIPFFIAHGDSDHTVPPGQSVLLRDALTTAGTAPEYMSIAGADHMFQNASSKQRAALAAKTKSFLAAKL